MSQDQFVQRPYQEPGSPTGAPVFSSQPYDDILLSSLEGFGKLLRERITSLRELIAAEDRAGFVAVCHKAAGSALTFGYGEIARQLKIMEDAAKRGAPQVELGMLLKLAAKLADRILLGIRIKLALPDSHEF